jgi:hypothetical protein
MHNAEISVQCAAKAGIRYWNPGFISIVDREFALSLVSSDLEAETSVDSDPLVSFSS